jgi:hypothetical protein
VPVTVTDSCPAFCTTSTPTVVVDCAQGSVEVNQQCAGVLSDTGTRFSVPMTLLLGFGMLATGALLMVPVRRRRPAARHARP